MRGLLVRELRELRVRWTQLAGAMPVDVMGMMLGSAVVLGLH